MQGPPRGAFVPAGARAAGAIVVYNCPAPNPGYPTAPLSISLLVGKVAIVPDDDDLPAFGRRADPSAAIAIAAQLTGGSRRVRDPYEILGVKRGASLDEIKAAYRRASKQRHPDMRRLERGDGRAQHRLRLHPQRTEAGLPAAAKGGAETATERRHGRGRMA